MRKNTFCFLILALILSACSFPGAVKTPPPNAVASQVALMLTLQPTPTSPAAASSATQAPAVTPSAQPSQTVEPTAAISPTPTITSTTPPSDPKLSLGAPAYKNTLESSKSFGLYDNGQTRVVAGNGVLTMTAVEANGWHGWTLTAPTPRDFYLEAVLRTHDCAGSDKYGVVIRAPDYESGQGYYFGATCDGRYSFEKWSGDDLSDILGLTPSEDILAGSNQTNRLGILAKGNHISLYANGKLLQEFDDTTFPENGHFGVFIIGVQTAGFTFDLDEIAYWNLP